jgi:Meiotically up-regulated gene 113
MLLKDLSMANYVYLIRADGTERYKIGKTDRHPETRLKELNRQQSAYPLLLEYYVEVPDSAVAENHFHQRYQRYRQHGEWFEMSRAISAQVVQDFKGYKPGISNGAGKPKPQRRSQKKRRPGRKASTPTITIILLTLLAILLTQWQKLPQISKCSQALDFDLCARIIVGR